MSKKRKPHNPKKQVQSLPLNKQQFVEHLFRLENMYHLNGTGFFQSYCRGGNLCVKLSNPSKVISLTRKVNTGLILEAYLDHFYSPTNQLVEVLHNFYICRN